MRAEPGNVQYSLAEPFERAADLVSKSLLARKLRIAGHLEVSDRLQDAIGIVLQPCRILFVLPDGSDGVHPWAGLFLPLHVVIWGDGSQTEIQVQNRVQTFPETATPALIHAVLETQAQVREAIEAVATRPSLIV